MAKSKAPLLINSCEVDKQFPQESQAIADVVFEGRFAPGYKREYWDGCTHGFAVRGDLVSRSMQVLSTASHVKPQSNPKVKAGKEGAFAASVNWFKKYL